MGDTYPQVRLAAIQASSIWLDRDATVAKACRLIEEAADHGARVIGFPEGFLPGFPYWYHWHMVQGPTAMRFSRELFKNAVEVPGPATEAIGAAARKAKCYVVVGANERQPGSLGTLYNSQIFFDPEGAVLGVHRKLMPTLSERLVHGAGDGSGLKTYPTPFGAIGGLICAENTNSLARFALIAQDERIHIASWPAFPEGKRPKDGIDIRMRYHALEGRVFVISACGVLDDATLDTLEVTPDQRRAMAGRGGHSGIVGPDGNYIAGPVDDTPQIVYGDAQIERIIEGKFVTDVTGHYNRFDIFDLRVRPTNHQAVNLPSGGRDVSER